MQWTAWKAGIALALLGAATGAVYAYSQAAPRINVELRAVDSMPPARTKFQLCAQFIDPGDCGANTPPAAHDFRVKFETDRKTVVVEYQQENQVSLALAQRYAVSFVRPRPYLLSPIVTGALAGFVFGFLGYRLSCALLSS